MKLFFSIHLTWKQWQELCVRGGSEWILDFFFSTGRVVRHSNELKMFNRTLDVALGVWFRCDYGGTGLMVGLNLGGLFQPWALWLRPYPLQCGRDPHGVVTRLGWWSHRGSSNRTGVLRLGLAEQLCWIWQFFWDFSRNMATIISCTSPCGGFRM